MTTDGEHADNADDELPCVMRSECEFEEVGKMSERKLIRIPQDIMILTESSDFRLREQNALQTSRVQ